MIMDTMHVVKSANDMMELSLICRCSLYQPTWAAYKHDSHMLEYLNGDFKCMNVTSGEYCDRPLAYIEEEDQNEDIFILNSHKFVIDQTTMLMCYPGKDFVRTIVIITVSGMLNIIYAMM